jgi:hypothetical protein
LVAARNLDDFAERRDFVAVGDVAGAQRAEAPGEAGARRIVVVNWTLDADNLVTALRASTREGTRVVCVGGQPAANVQQAWASRGDRADVRYLPAPSASDDLDGLAKVLREQADIATASSVIVVPDPRAREPDASSRVTCVAVGRACGDRPVPNILVEVRDPEAAYEFAGLGVATVFYPGYLRAALLAHACVDLGVFQFLYGLLCGDLRVRLLPLPEGLRAGSFYDAVLAHEEDDAGNPVTLIGVQGHNDAGPQLLINPGPTFSMRRAVGVLALQEGR